MAEPSAIPSPADFRREPPSRPDRIHSIGTVGTVPAVERPLPLWERAFDAAWFRRALLLTVLAVLWEAYAVHLGNPLMLPSFTETASALANSLASGGLADRVLSSLGTLLRGYAIGAAAALVLTTLAVSTRIGEDLLSTLTSMFNPLPAIALLPIAMLWFGLGQASLVFVLVHAVLWPLALNTHAGFTAVPETLRMAGRNYGLRGVRYVLLILVPAALPSIITGLRIGWAFAWRTLIAAELVFGVSSGQGGLGWFIFQNRNELLIDNVFAGLITVVLIGLLVEGVLFRWLESATVRRWGMVR